MGVRTQFADQTEALDDADYARSLGAVPDGPAKARGITVGELAAAEVVDARASDGFEADVSYMFGSGPGVWVLPTDNQLTVPATPWVAKMQMLIDYTDVAG